MVIMFVRHGDANEKGLTELGKHQCELMCEGEEKYKFSKIYCSSVERCKLTAEYLKNYFNIEVEYFDKLRDREVLSDAPQNEQEQLWYDNYLNKNFSSKSPEGCKEFLERNFNVFDEIIKNHKNKNENVILVAHSCTFYAIQEYFNKTAGSEINYYRLSNCAKVYFEIR